MGSVEGRGGSGAASLMGGVFLQQQKRRLVPRCGPRSREVTRAAGHPSVVFSGGLAEALAGGVQAVISSRKGYLSPRDLSLGTCLQVLVPRQDV